jgi:hypothetical protein
MRYTSALQILRYMRAHFGEKPNISAVCRGVTLSYQPTHYHIQQLEELSVLGTLKSGREVLCLLVNSPATALWLGMLCQRERKRLAGPTGQLVSGLQPYLEQHWYDFSCIALMGQENRLIAVTQASNREPAARLTARCQAIAPALLVEAMTAEEFLEHLETRSGIKWAREAIIVSGHQPFWHYALSAGEGLGLVLGLESDG